MKKQFFFMVAAAIALASCSSEDVVEPNNGNAIDFRVAMGTGANSRSTETTTQDLGQFKVTAFANGAEYFSDLLFSQVGTTTTYNSATTYYWPSTHTVEFYAYSYYTGKTDAGVLIVLDENKLKVDDGFKTITGFTPAAEIAEQIDPVTAYATGTRAANETSGVSLTFKHMLSQIQVKAKTTNKTYKFSIKDVKIANVNSVGGTWTIAETPTWTQPETKTPASYTLSKETAVVLDPEATEAQDLMVGENSAMLLPQELTSWDKTKANINSGTYLAVLLKIETTDTKALVYPAANVEGGYGWALVPISTIWNAGYRYIYTLDFSNGAGWDENGDPILGGPILCNVDVETWESNTSNIDVDMKNGTGTTKTPTE